MLTVKLFKRKNGWLIIVYLSIAIGILAQALDENQEYEDIRDLLPFAVKGVKLSVSYTLKRKQNKQTATFSYKMCMARMDGKYSGNSQTRQSPDTRVTL